MERLFSSHTNTFQEGMKLITIKLWLVSFHHGTLKFVKRVNIPRQTETNLLFSSLLKSCVLTLVSFPLETRELLWLPNCFQHSETPWFQKTYFLVLLNKSWTCEKSPQECESVTNPVNIFWPMSIVVGWKEELDNKWWFRY